jgi:hypothetical protein
MMNLNQVLTNLGRIEFRPLKVFHNEPQECFRSQSHIQLRSSPNLRFYPNIAQSSLFRANLVFHIDEGANIPQSSLLSLSLREPRVRKINACEL